MLGTGRRLFPDGGRASLRITDSVITTKGVLMATYELDRDLNHKNPFRSAAGNRQYVPRPRRPRKEVPDHEANTCSASTRQTETRRPDVLEKVIETCARSTRRYAPLAPGCSRAGCTSRARRQGSVLAHGDADD